MSVFTLLWTVATAVSGYLLGMRRMRLSVAEACEGSGIAALVVFGRGVRRISWWRI